MEIVKKIVDAGKSFDMGKCSLTHNTYASWCKLDTTLILMMKNT
jgi:hypothetical protein